MVMTRPPAYHPGNFLMKNMNPTNSGLITLLNTNTNTIPTLPVLGEVGHKIIHYPTRDLQGRLSLIET